MKIFDFLGRLIVVIGNRRDVVCLQLHGQVSGQPKCCHSYILDPKGLAFCFVSGSLLTNANEINLDYGFQRQGKIYEKSCS